jgi:hypothetical protein
MDHKMLRPTARLSVCLIAAGFAASCGGSQNPDLSVVDKSFLGGIASYDQNNDNNVTCDEWKVAAAKLFTRADKANAGFLTPETYGNLAAIDRTYLVTDFKFFDKNGDGKISKEEFVGRPNPAFNFADKDKDCRLTELELLTARNLSTPPAATRAKAPSGPVDQRNRSPTSPGSSSSGY